MKGSPVLRDRNGRKGEIQYRGRPIESLVGVTQYEDIMHLLIWGHLPTGPERINFSMSLATFPLPPTTVFDAIRAFPYVILSFVPLKAD